MKYKALLVLITRLEESNVEMLLGSEYVEDGFVILVKILKFKFVKVLIELVVLSVRTKTFWLVKEQELTFNRGSLGDD